MPSSASTDGMSNKSTPRSSTVVDGTGVDIKAEKEAKQENVEDGDVNSGKKHEVEEEDDEEIGSNLKALTHLLKTSSLFTSLLADRMKEQQKRSAEQAKKSATREKNAEAKANAAKEPPRKSSRAQAQEDGAEDENEEPQTKKMATRGRPKKNATKKGSSIADALRKQGVSTNTDAPNVQEAIAEAADKHEGEALGAQELAATEQPKLVTGGKMRRYQLEGLEWLKTLWMNGLGGILADEMGLGKTVQAISLLAFFKENNISGPFLVAAPLSTVRNWVEEFKFWTPEIKTVLYHGSKDEREAIRSRQMKLRDQAAYDFPVVVTSYEICMNDRKFLANYQWRYIIVDEGHRLKNMNCKLIKELMQYRSANRLLITGTPLQNNIIELWSLLHFLLPEVFNNVDDFQKWFDFSSVLEDRSDADGKATKRKSNLVGTMHAILKPFLLRRVKTDVEASLPKKREYILYAPLTAEQKDLYREIAAGTGRAYLEEKAVERLESRAGSKAGSRAPSKKRKAMDSGRSTPAKSIKSTRDSTPASVVSTSSTRRGRKGARTNYADVTDREFNKKLRQLEDGLDADFVDDSSPPPAGLSSDEAEELERAQTLKLAKKEIASKKLQNPIMQLRLACNSPHNFYWPWTPSTAAEEASGDYPEVDETLVTASGKMLLLDTLLARLFKLGHKVLIFSQFKTTLDIIHTYASELRGWQSCRIDGSISQDERYQQITAFNNDKKFKLFLLSTRAGGQGINLTAADTVILFDSDWNPQQDLQAMDRAHRIGQKRPVIVYRLATRGTVEEQLLFKADNKRKLEKLVIQKGKFKSLFDGVDGTKAKLGPADADDLRGVLAGDEFEKYDVGDILKEEELQILTDRSEKAYERVEQGLESKGTAFKAVETKAGSDVLEDFTTRTGAKD